MKCNGEYKGDRVCELCSICNSLENEICFKTYIEKQEKEQFKYYMYKNCSNSKYEQDGYYDGCYMCKIRKFNVSIEFFACFLGVILYFFVINILLKSNVNPICLKMILGILLIIFLRLAANVKFSIKL